MEKKLYKKLQKVPKMCKKYAENVQKCAKCVQKGDAAEAAGSRKAQPDQHNSQAKSLFLLLNMKSPELGTFGIF